MRGGAVDGDATERGGRLAEEAVGAEVAEVAALAATAAVAASAEVAVERCCRSRQGRTNNRGEIGEITGDRQRASNTTRQLQNHPSGEQGNAGVG